MHSSSVTFGLQCDIYSVIHSHSIIVISQLLCETPAHGKATQMQK